MTRRASIRLRAVAPSTAPSVPEPPRLSVAPAITAPAVDLALLNSGARGPEALEARESLRRRLLAAADVIAMGVALVAVVSRFGTGRGGLTGLAAMPVVLAVLGLAGLYHRDELRLQHSTLDEVPMLVQATALFALGASLFASILSTASFTATQIAVLWLATLGAVLAGRVVARSVAGRLIPGERCLIVGDVHRTDRIRARIVASSAPTAVVECLATDDLLSTAGGFSAITSIVRELGIDRIVVAPSSAAADHAAELLRVAKGTGVRLSLVPEALEAAGSAVAFDELEGMVMLGLPRFGLRESSRHAKRVFDILATIVGLVIVAPLLAWIALAIRIDSKGPIFFRQTRIGRHGRPFRILKFRSMVADAEAQKDALRALNIAGQGLFKLVDDPRTTRVGRVLRMTSLDELPQLFNVLRGDMTLVGPRPLVPDEDAQVLGLHRCRLLLTPGLTGPWQLMGARVSLEEMVEVDYLYASSWSLWRDLKILLRTVSHVVRRGNL